jgi:hypothetical protein
MPRPATKLGDPLDHFGAFGLTPHPIGAARLAGPHF